MIDLRNVKGFQWDKGNVDKSYQKHGITPNETEEVFLDKDLGIEKDIKHQEIEERFIAIGKTGVGRILFVVFTMRKNKIRIISARVANEKERRKYETSIKKDS